MSERGSFVTEYFDCRKCFDAARRLLVGRDKYLCSTAIPTWENDGDGVLPIIAGKLGGLYAGEEIHAMEELLRLLKPHLCEGHDVQVAVIPDSAEPVVLCTNQLRARPRRLLPQPGESPPPWHRLPNELDDESGPLAGKPAAPGSGAGEPEVPE